MADNVAITAGSGTSVAADEVVDGTLGTVKVQFTKLMDGTLDSTNKAVVTASGALKVDLVSTAANTAALKVDGSAVTQPISGAVTVTSGTTAATQSGTWTVQPGNTANTTPWLVNVRLGGNAPDLGSGTGGSATQRVIVDSSQFAALQTAATTISTGGQLVLLPNDQPVPIKMQAITNGMTSSRVDSAATTNATNLKAGAGNLANIDVFNVAAYDVFLKIYNKSSAPTVGSDTPVWTIPVKAGQGYARTFPLGKFLGTGISYAITKLQVDTDTTAVVAHDLTGSIDWI